MPQRDTSRTWEDGLNIDEIQANLLESGQLTAMRIPPSWEVEKLRHGNVDMKALEDLITKFNVNLEPYRLPPARKDQLGRFRKWAARRRLNGTGNLPRMRKSDYG